MIIKLKTDIIHFDNKRYKDYPSPQYDKFVKALDYAEENYDPSGGVVIAYHFCKEKNNFTPVYEECTSNAEIVEEYLNVINGL